MPSAPTRRAGPASGPPPDPRPGGVWGPGGALPRRKLLPALYHLYLEGLLPPRFAIVGYSRRELSDDDFRKLAHDACMEFGRCRMDRQEWGAFSAGFCVLAGGLFWGGAPAPPP